MLPIKRINIGDIFQNPLFKDGVLFVVEDVDIFEKIVKVQPHYFKNGMPLGSPIWKSNRDRMFNESWLYFKN